VATPDDDERTVADARAAKRARAVTEEEATRVEPPRRLDEGATEIAPESKMPVLKQIRSKASGESERDREPANRLAPPVPASPPHAPVPSVPTDPVGVMPFAPSAPTVPTPIVTDDEATRLAPKADKEKKKAVRPVPPLMQRPARRALQKVRHFTSEIAAVSINSKSVSRRRASRLLIAVIVSFALVVMIQVYKAFTSDHSAEMARPLGHKKAEDPGFFERLFGF
jgi:hypothetical protein